MLGIDLVENERIEKSIKRFGDRFLKRVFTDEEIEYCRGYRDPVPCLAARWAAKEAVIKAFFWRFGVVLKFKQIEVKGKKGFPASVVIHGQEGLLLEERGLKVVLSLTHEKKFSAAVVQIVRRDTL